MSAIGSISASQAQLAQQIGTAVAVKGREIAESQGQAAISMLQQALEFQQALNAGPQAPGRLDVVG